MLYAHLAYSVIVSCCYHLVWHSSSAKHLQNFFFPFIKLLLTLWARGYHVSVPGLCWKSSCKKPLARPSLETLGEQYYLVDKVSSNYGSPWSLDFI